MVSCTLHNRARRSYLSSVYLLQRFEIFQDNIYGKRRLPKSDSLHRLPVVRRASATCLYTLPEVVFYAIKDDRGVVHSVYLRSEELLG